MKEQTKTKHNSADVRRIFKWIILEKIQKARDLAAYNRKLSQELMKYLEVQAALLVCFTYTDDSRSSWGNSGLFHVYLTTSLLLQRIHCKKM